MKNAHQTLIECLSNMAICSGETDFLKYTGAWIEQINRGSLFEVNDTTYIHVIQTNRNTFAKYPTKAFATNGSRQHQKEPHNVSCSKKRCPILLVRINCPLTYTMKSVHRNY